MTLKNTENDAIISIKNLQSAEDMQEETELITEGRFYESGDKLYIFYTEEDTEDMPGSTVMIVVTKGDVTISRKGDFGAKMRYSAGEHEQVIYHTPFGDMHMMLETLQVDNHLTVDGGTLKLIYRLSVNGDIIHNNLTITVKNGKGEQK